MLYGFVCALGDNHQWKLDSCDEQQQGLQFEQQTIRVRPLPTVNDGDSAPVQDKEARERCHGSRRESLIGPTPQVESLAGGEGRVAFRFLKVSQRWPHQRGVLRASLK